MDHGLGVGEVVIFEGFLEAEAVLEVGVYGHFGEAGIVGFDVCFVEDVPDHAYCEVGLPAGFGVCY